MSLEYRKGYGMGEIHSRDFNGKTMISFKIPRETFVSLKVYSTHGKEIAELAGKVFSPGEHIVEFKRDRQARGVYLYQIRADKFSACRKLVLPVY
jgi:hypothetical protein